MFTNFYEPYISALQQWNNIILFACILGFWLSLVLNRLPRKIEPVEYAYLEKVLSPFFWIPLFMLAIVLRLPLMDAQPWYDETYTYLMATTDWSAFPPALLSDVHPPMFYMLERLMVAIFGASMWALRLPSLIAGLALIWVVYRVAFALYGSHQTAKLSAVIVTILPQTIYYSTEARYPVLLAVVVLLAFLAVIEDKPHRFIILGALPVYLHSMGIFYAGLLMVGALLHRRSRQWIIAIAMVGCLAVLWMPGVLIQSQVVGNGFWLQLEYPVTFITDMTTGRFLPMYPLFLLWVLMFGLSFLALHHPQKKPILWALLALGVPLAAWLVSVAWKPIYLPRALMASTMLFIPIWADFLRRYRWLMVVSALLLAFPLYGLYTHNRGAVGDALELCKGADNVYALANTMAIPALYYVPDTPVHIWELSNEVDLTTEFTPAIQRAFNFTITDNPDELENVCIPVGINPYTSELELAELERLAQMPGVNVQTVNAHDFAKYVVIRRISDGG